MEHIITTVENDSIGYELGLQPGDILISIDDKDITDVFDYRFYIKSECLTLLVRKPNGEEWLLEIEKDEDEDIGLGFDTGLMDQAKECCNSCIFCFIDQLPPDMRKSLHVYDDDARLSFLTGNYVTLTNMSEKELDRIIYYHLSPINISIHTTDMTLRQFILGNRYSSDIMEWLRRLYTSGITMNYQIVLCKGINDGVNLQKSIEDLSQFIPMANSLSIVPVGLSRYREGLYELQPFSKEDAVAVIAQVTELQQKLTRTKGNPFVYCADEFYIKAEIDFPTYEQYSDFPQLENGVGMSSHFLKEFTEELAETKSCQIREQAFSIITGQASSDLIKKSAVKLKDKYPQLSINVFVIENHFFGEYITVSGLLTGQDIIEQLKGKDISGTIFIPANALRAGTDTFLDDMTICQLEKELNSSVIPLASMGSEFFRLLK